ncbi:EAL domain-containing protein [Actinoplanes sp. TBRC 11911]|uniref:EAL domain-containing protein n=1 Tax=Actinoplanes sp. TBRC 11911 TaxID=2729386 RepID=UPI00145E0B02|nr:EAL domain-containing protein [Actinoplanes sp. TBRC 11911]NMO51175.1 EAL domain-containing protein [Actinoplanes sp. TBRC 11911]
MTEERHALIARAEDTGPPALRHAGVSFAALENPLERFGPLIERLARVTRPDAAHLRAALSAEAVAILERTPSGFTTIDATPGFDSEPSRDLLGARDCLDRLWTGHHAWDARRSLLSVPLHREPGKVVLLAVRNPASGMGEPLARILQTLWRTRGEPHDDIEIQVLTDLRRDFRLPVRLYERYRRLQRAAIESLSIVFQPIVSLGKIAGHVGVHSFEALARRAPLDAGAPVGLLNAAHVWGDDLVVERDEIIVAKALSAYASAHRSGPWDIPKPVSVNVSVRSLLSDAYLGSLREALASTGLRQVTLEISEQDPIRPRRDEIWDAEPHAYFHERLQHLARETGVAFAVDDFGSDYASVSRMAELPLTQIKVDRRVLHHPTALAELRFVEEIARHRRDRAARTVVVEGVDDLSPITLKQIYAVPIRHVQGYLAQQGAPSLHELKADVREDIAARVRGDAEQRATGLPALRRSA